MSDKFEWKSDYAVDGGRIDDEHKQLLNLANQVLAFTDPSRQADEVTDTVKQLFKYMEFHFDNEQGLMREAGYPEHEEHAQAHAKIISDMNNLLKTSSNLDQLVVELKPAMRNWVVQHILDEDKKIAKYLKVDPDVAESSKDE